MTSPAGSDVQRMMQYDANKKSVVAAYLLWFFLGGFGAHRFYLGRTGSAIGMLVLLVASVILSIIVIGGLGFIALGIWWLVDGFLIPGMASSHNNRLAVALGA